MNKEIEGGSDYLIMCEKNKKLDKLIGHSILITELEKKKIVKEPKKKSVLDGIKQELNEWNGKLTEAKETIFDVAQRVLDNHQNEKYKGENLMSIL